MAKAKTVTPFHYNAPLMLLVCYDARAAWRNPGDRAKPNGWHFKRNPTESFVTEL